ncbi:PD40 domain-containing protein [Pyxidicoccus parkwayensis]|uniref:PD40 domain-containing protein n=1 Tax=Pyxidicoccus parkwayensis TaxID=2813578 RepID=A0ABX7P0A9_9BACT|nr:PD40 domain-containing protein [Pyxidicoccus parkwaysis]QSQ24500.1 PD40 domain-containing protein [Pyxidicoccus parkwaysis]
MIVAPLILALIAAGPVSPERYLAFGNSEGWVALEVHSRKVERIRIPAPYQAKTLTISTDGEHVVFTSHDEAARNDLLYRWDWRKGASPVRIGDEQGFHADPAISPDGKWVYFAHHPRMGGPPGMHQPEANAQLYRVRLDGQNLTALSNEKGCHLSPSFRPDGELIYVHTLCSVTQKSLRLMKNGVVLPDILATEELNEPSFSPDGKRLVFVSRNGPHALLKEWNSMGRPARVVHQYLLREGSRGRAQYGRDAREILFQNEDSVMRLAGAAATRLFSFGDVP